MSKMSKVLRAVPVLAVDLVGIAGAGAVAYGTWLIYPPAGFIAGGVLAIVFAWLIARGGPE